MAFDSGMLAAVCRELNNEISGGRIDRVNQPARDEFVLSVRAIGSTKRLMISAGAANPRIGLTSLAPDNPSTPPSFCLLLRRYLTGAHIDSIEQCGFERVLKIAMTGRDEMGFVRRLFVYVEIMGTYSNLILCDGNERIIAAARQIDFSTSRVRQVLPQMKYEMPPSQNKKDPRYENEEGFISTVTSGAGTPDRAIMNGYMGISPLVAREIVYRSEKNSTTLWTEFNGVMDTVRQGSFTAVMLRDNNDKPLEYCYIEIGQYGTGAVQCKYNSFGELTDAYFAEREQNERVRQRAGDIVKLVTNAEARLTKKIALQEADIASAAQKDKYRFKADLITANIYKLKRGQQKAYLTDYSDGEAKDVEITLDSRLTPSQNAQKYYKKYNKLKTAEHELAHQMEMAIAELDYINSVAQSLEQAETEADLTEIRQELYKSGYASKMKNYGSQKKAPSSHPMEFVTDGGFRLFCGKNNTQNDRLTLKTAEKSDWWFHVKDAAGSHVILSSEGKEPSEADFTQAASVAAYYSKQREGKNVAVDYTLVKNIKKPGGSKPGFVIYKTNYTAFVTPSRELCEHLRDK